MKNASYSPFIFRSLSGTALIIVLTFSSFGEIAAQDDQPTDDEVNTIAKQLYFSEQYGVRVLAEPPTQGFNVLFWALPPVVIIVGWFFVLRFIHAIRRKQPAAGQPVKKQRDAEEYTARLEDELAQWK